MILSNGTSLSSYSFAALCFGTAFYLLTTLAYWNIFSNAGESRWKAFIPVVRTHAQYRISWRTSKFWLTCAFAVLGCAAVAVCYPNMLDALNGSLAPISSSLTPLNSSMASMTSFWENSLGVYIGAALLIASYCIHVRALWFLGKSFGQGWGFFILAAVFPTLARLGLGLSPVCYKGNVALAR